MVVPSPLIHTLKYFHHLLRFHRVIGLKKNICGYKTRKFLNLHVSIHGYFWISVYWNTEIQKYEQFCLTKLPCFNTWRFLNLRVLKYRDSKISVFKPRRFLNLYVLKHGEWFALQNLHVFNTWRFLNLRLLKYGESKISMFKHRRFLNIHVLKHGDSKISMFWNTSIKFCLKKFKIPILKLL